MTLTPVNSTQSHIKRTKYKKRKRSVFPKFHSEILRMGDRVDLVEIPLLDLHQIDRAGLNDYRVVAKTARSEKNKMIIYPPTHPRTFGTIKYIVSIFYRTKNKVRGLCVGGDMVILFFSDPAVFTQTLTM